MEVFFKAFAIITLALMVSCQKGVVNDSIPSTTQTATSTDQFTVLIFDGIRDSINRSQFHSTIDTIYASGNSYGTGFMLVATAGWSLSFSFSNSSTGPATFIRQLFVVTPHSSAVFSPSGLASITLNITEYGLPGEYIAGNFSGTAPDIGGLNHTFSCFFRVKRRA